MSNQVSNRNGIGSVLVVPLSLPRAVMATMCVMPSRSCPAHPTRTASRGRASYLFRCTRYVYARWGQPVWEAARLLGFMREATRGSELVTSHSLRVGAKDVCQARGWPLGPVVPNMGLSTQEREARVQVGRHLIRGPREAVDSPGHDDAFV